jgi:hypothetical protein
MTKASVPAAMRVRVETEMSERLAGLAWLVKVDVSLGVGQTEVRYFAVATHDADSAALTVSRFPGIAGAVRAR